jgi:hypothetical protein
MTNHCKANASTRTLSASRRKRKDTHPGNIATMKVSNQAVFHLFKRALGTAAISSMILLGSIAGMSAQVLNVDIDTPSMDKWMYPFGQGGGPRDTASTFGAVGSAGFDDRDAQFFNRFTTSGDVPAGLGAANYQILSATFTLTITLSGGDGALFDGTYDLYTTFDPLTGDPVNDLDAGRPMELYGAAFRNGITKSFTDENLPFAPAGPVAEERRNIYATDFLAAASLNGANRDVSNNVTTGFDAVPFAIGQVAAEFLNPNGTMKAEAEVVFTLNLSNPDVVRYLQLSLDAGSVDLIATSLASAEQLGPVVYPIFNTKENAFGVPGRLEMQVAIPEASTVTLLLCGCGLFVGFWRGRQVIQSGESNI